MKKLFIVLLVFAFASCSGKQKYHQYTVEVCFTDGTIDTLSLPYCRTSQVGIDGGCLYTDRHSRALACGVKYVNVLTHKTQYY